jgi:hypothetical protein
MPATFTPYLERRYRQARSDAEAYIRVRVPDVPRSDGSMLVYLADGTALVVNGHLLLHVDTSPDCPDF